MTGPRPRIGGGDNRRRNYGKGNPLAGDVPALSIRQPWAWAICYAGKWIENRTRNATYRGPLWIHASVTHNRAQFAADVAAIEAILVQQVAPEWLKLTVPAREDLAFGAFVGACDLEDSFSPDPLLDRGPWAVREQWNWQLGSVAPFAFALPAPGALGLWYPTIAECAELQVRAQCHRDGVELAKKVIKALEPPAPVTPPPISDPDGAAWEAREQERAALALDLLRQWLAIHTIADSYPAQKRITIAVTLTAESARQIKAST